MTRAPWRAIWLPAAAAWLAGCGGGNEYVEPPPPTVIVSQPVQRTVTEYLEATGTTESIATVEIRARVKGFLESIEFEEGDFVGQGDLLYVIDPSEYRAAVDRAEAAVAVAKASLDLAGATRVRLERALKTRAVSEIDVIEARAQQKEAKATLDARRADLETAKLDLGYTRIQSPISGRVGRTLVDTGNLVGAGENTLLTTVVQYDPMYAYFDVSEREVLRLSERSRGQPSSDDDRLGRLRATPLELGLANERGYPHRGNLHYTDQGVDPGTGTFLVRGIFPNPAPIKLLPGLFVRLRVPIGEREGALLISERALGSDQGGRFLLVVDDENVVQQRPVEVGTSLDGMRVIESGLEPDDRVIVEGALRARPGARVSPQREEASPREPEAPGSQD